MYTHFNYVLVLLFVTLAFIWYYKKYIRIYSKFPTFSLLPVVLKCMLTGKIPKDVPATSFYFQKLTDMLKERQSDGLCLLWILQPFLFIWNEEAVKIFCNEQSALNRPNIYSVLEDALGTGLITSNGDLWRKRRKMFNPIFKISMLKDKISIMNENAAILVKKLWNISNESSVDVMEHLKFCCLSIICESIVGLDLNDPERYAEAQNFIECVNKSSEMVIYRILHPWLLSKYTLRFFSKGREYLRQVEEGQQFITKILLEMKESSLSVETEEKLNGKDEFDKVPRRSFAQLLINHHLNDPSFTVKDMLDELTTFIIAGYDTVSYSLMWSLFLLGHHSEVQDQAYNELEAVMENDLSYNDLDKLTYMECVIKETLRLYPTAPVYARCVNKNVQCGKYTVPKDTTIVFIPFLSHRDPKIYPDPERFDPERFLERNSGEKRWSHIPFGQGIRKCIGENYSMIELKVVLAHIIKNFKVTSLDRREDINLNWEGMLTTVEPLRMRLTSRQKTVIE